MLNAFACTILAVVCIFYARGQEGGDLNGFKYAAVETLFYDDDQVDIRGISAMTRQRLIILGLRVVANNEESWPPELKDTPCLLIDFRITAKDRSLGRQKVVIDGL